MTEAVAQMPYAIASRPQAMIIHKAVIDLNPGLMSVPGPWIPTRSLPSTVVAPAGGKWRGYSQKRRAHAMVGTAVPAQPRPGRLIDTVKGASEGWFRGEEAARQRGPASTEIRTIAESDT